MSSRLRTLSAVGVLALAVAGVDQQIAARLGTDAREIQINDLAISPSSKNAFVSVSRGRGGSTSSPAISAHRW